MAQAQLQAGLEREAAKEMMDARMEQAQLDTNVMIAPDIVISNVSTVEYELCEHHNNVNMLRRPRNYWSWEF